MRLLKIIVVVFLIYFVRRFFQMYQAMKRIQEERLAEEQSANRSQGPQPKKGDHIVDAEFKVMD